VRNLILALTLCAACGNATYEESIEYYDTDIEMLFRKTPAEKYIIVLEDNADVNLTARDLKRQHGLTNHFTYHNTIRGFSASIPEKALSRIGLDNRVRYIERDAIINIDKGPPAGKGPGNNDSSDCSSEPTQLTPYGTIRVGGPVDGTGLTAWVIDTGIDLDNCDLNVDVDRSANFIRKGKDSANDGHGHGTHVAGTIGALDNGINTVGVAPGATVVAVRVLDNRGSGSTSGVIAGIEYVTANGAPGDVANMSLGGGYSSALNEAVWNSAQAGILYSVAAGNDSSHAGNYSPASVNHPNVYTVSAVNSNDVFASFSNYGNPPVDYAAPGVGILSLNNGSGTTTKNGTSMAAPHVAGLLLFGSPLTSGYAINDPDGIADPIAHH